MFKLWRKGKKLAVFCVGATLAESPEISVVLDKNFNTEQKSVAKIFYCQGGLDYEKVKKPVKLILKMFAAALAKKKDVTESEKKLVEMLSKSFDISDKKFITPIVEYLKA